MSKSLRDQLVEAGLASASQAKKAKKQVLAEEQARKAGRNANSKKSGKKASKGAKAAGELPPSSAQKARQQRSAKAQRDQELAKQRNQKAAERAKRAQIKQIVTQNDQRSETKDDSDVAYNFLHNKKIKRIYVPPKQVEALSKGELRIVNNDGRYHLVTAEVAQKIIERDPKWVLNTLQDNTAQDPAMDDYYKKFEVPDDLDW